MKFLRSRRARLGVPATALAITTAIGLTTFANGGADATQVRGGHTTRPGEVLGAPETAHTKASGDVRWILPGPRRLDPNIFGTPDQPLGFEEGVGVPLDDRNTTPDGTAYTTTKSPTPFSDNWAQITGRGEAVVLDRTARAGDSTRDRIHDVYTFTSPDGAHRYRVETTRPLSRLPDHENFGGVGLNVAMHGRTGIGTKLMPQFISFITYWGVADLYVDGQKVANDRFVHVMTAERSRDIEGDYSLGFDEDVDPNSVHTHLILPPIRVTDQGPVDSPVPTGFTLPNGMEQPFLHIMYEQVNELRGT
jgi:hypothetical protein